MDLTAHRSRTWAGQGNKDTSDANGNYGGDPANNAALRGHGRGNQGGRGAPGRGFAPLQETRHCVCVDNVGVIGSNLGAVGQRMEEFVETFERWGLEVHEQELHSGGVEALGVVLDGERQHTRISSRWFWKVRGAPLALARRRRVSGRQVEAVIGRATFCGLVRRETLVGLLRFVGVYTAGW